MEVQNKVVLMLIVCVSFKCHTVSVMYIISLSLSLVVCCNGADLKILNK